MKKVILLSFILANSLLLMNAQTPSNQIKPKPKISISVENSEEKAPKITNPLLQQWNTPFETPPFDQIQLEHYLPAFQAAIKEANVEVHKLSQMKSHPTFENTIRALDNSGALLERVSSIFFNLLSANTSPEMQELAAKIQPMVTSHNNDIYMNRALFERVNVVYNEREQANIKGEELVLLEKTYRAFVKNGATFGEQDQIKFREINLMLADLSLQFSNNVLAANNGYSQILTKKQIQGLPKSILDIAADKAKAKNQKGYLFDLSAPSYLAIMKYADNREVRETFFREYNSRAFAENSNQQIIMQLVKLRNTKANMLGFKNYAAYALSDRMANNEEDVYRLLDELREASYPVAKKELQDLNDYAKTEGLVGELQKWDFSYYAEKMKNEKFNLNDEMLKPYFKLENVITGVFSLSEKLFSLTYVENDDIQTYHPDVKAYEVYQKEQFMGVLYLDFHPRNSKRPGAWMTSYREQYYTEVRGKEVDIRPIVSLVMNFTPSTADSPSLLTFDEVTTFLHEFGHGLHGLLSQVRYKSLSGTNVPRDFVELPSQLMENWASQQDFLKTFAFHYETKEVIPQDLIKKIKEVDNYLAGYYSVRQLTFGYLDMRWHTIHPDEVGDVVKLESEVMKPLELMPVVEGTCLSTSFGHIFSGGYAAGYYSYKWAEVLDADAFSLFLERGVMDRKTADIYVREILSKGSSRDVMESYVKFRGHEPSTKALLKRADLIK